MDRGPSERSGGGPGSAEWFIYSPGFKRGTIILVWLTLRIAADRWWLATVLLYGPRWIYGLPLLVLIPAAVYARVRKMALVLVSSAAMVVFPIMGCCVHWPSLRESASKGEIFRLLSCNVDGENMNPEALFGLINSLQPDAIACQEWPAQGDAVSPVSGGWDGM